MALVLADDAFVGHGFEDAQQRAAIGVVAVEQGHLGDALGDPPADPAGRCGDRDRPRSSAEARSRVHQVGPGL
jgi:hypothetical protein